MDNTVEVQTAFTNLLHCIKAYVRGEYSYELGVEIVEAGEYHTILHLCERQSSNAWGVVTGRMPPLKVSVLIIMLDHYDEHYTARAIFCHRDCLSKQLAGRVIAEVEQRATELHIPIDVL